MVNGKLMGIDTILDCREFIFTLSEEVKLELLLVSLAGDAADIPEVTASLCKEKMAAEVCTDHLRLIPKCRRVRNELGTMRLKSVSVRRVREHLGTGIQYDVHRELEASCSYAHRMLFDPASSVHILRMCCHHCTRSKVCSSEDVSHEWKPDGVVRTTSPLLLKTKDCLVSEDIRILDLPTLRSHRAMEINDQLVLCRLACRAVIEIDHILVTSVHEVDLHTSHAPVPVCLKDRIEVLVNRKP